MYLLQAKYKGHKPWITMKWSRNLEYLKAMIKECEDFDRDFSEVIPAACVYRIQRIQFRWPFVEEVKL